MKFSHRLWLASAIPLLALAFVSHQFYSQTVASGLAVAERQQAVLPVLRELRTLLEQVQNQRSRLPLAILGSPSSAQEVVVEAAAMRTSLDAIRTALAGRDAESRAGQAWGRTREALAPILRKASGGELEAFEVYSHAARAILDQTEALGNESDFSSGVAGATSLNLLLSDLIPSLVEDILLTSGLATFHLATGERSAADTSAIGSAMSLSRYRFFRVRAKLDSVTDLSAEFTRDMALRRAAPRESFLAFAPLVDGFLNGQPVDEPRLVHDYAEQTAKGAFGVFDRIFEEVEKALGQRIGEHRAALRNALGISVGAVVFSTLIMFFVISRFARATGRLVGVTEQIATGDRSIAVAAPSGRDEMSVLGRAVERMYREICATEETIRRESERKELVAEISRRLLAESDAEALGGVYLKGLAERFGLVTGAVYLQDPETGELRVASTYARDGAAAKATGSLVSEVVRSGRALQVDGLSERNAAAAETGLLRILPEAVMLAPVTFEQETLGVVEAGFLRRMSDDTAKLFEQTLSAFAVRLKATLARITLEGLYEQTREQARELEERQRELAASNVDLEMKTQELEQQQLELEATNQRLDVQQRELERKADDLGQASRYKSEFLANMSHELRSPLNSILIFSEILGKNERGALQPKEVEFARSIHSSGSDLLRLIEDILDLSKVEAGKLEITAEPFDLAAMLADLDGTFRQGAERKGLELVIDVAADVPARWITDRHRVGQILRNFLSNAIKFTDVGSVRLSIARAKALPPGAAIDPELAVEMAVTDTGIGIKSEDQRKLFVAFQQVDAGSNRKFSGTGLGLSISQQLAACLGGFVGMESAPGQGSTFRVVLPCEIGIEGAAVPAPVQVPAQGAAAGAARAAAGEDDRDGIGIDDKVMLVIEDDAGFAGYLVRSCRERGFKCVVARTGEDGLRDALAFRPSGIILDVKLPGMSGLAVLDRLRADPATKRIPVHVISAFEYRIEAERHERVGFLRKPVSHAQVQAVIAGIDGAAREPGRQILVVARACEDRDEIVHAIERQRARARPVDSGAAALDLLGEQAFDCVVMDVDLPQDSAIELLQRIKAAERHRDLPVVMLADEKLAPSLETELARHAGVAIVRGDKAKERLMDEVSLFLHSVSARSAPAPAREMAAGDGDMSSCRGRRVLVVDDDMRNLFAIMSVLESHGMVVHTAVNGREALDKLDSSPDFDIVLMDMMMPEVDGYEAMRRMRAVERLKKVPVIALTARAMKGEREECLAAGASDYLSKPLKIDQLLTLIKLWIA